VKAVKEGMKEGERGESSGGAGGLGGPRGAPQTTPLAGDRPAKPGRTCRKRLGYARRTTTKQWN